MSASGNNDAQAVLLRSCVFVLGGCRPDWGRAMLVELDQVKGRGSRWAFALGCMRSLALTMPASTAQKAIRLGAVVAGIGSLSLVAIAFIHYTGIASGARTWVAAAIFATVLLVYVLTGIAMGDRVADGRLMVASGLAGTLIAASWLTVGADTAFGGGTALTGALLGLGPLVALGLGWLTTAKSGSSRVGVACIGLTAVIAGFVLFLLWTGWTLTTAGRPYDAGLLRDFKASGFADVQTYAVNDSLGTAMVLLLLVPLLSGLSGMLGAAAARLRSTDRQE